MRWIGLALLFLVSNLFTYRMMNSSSKKKTNKTQQQKRSNSNLYLMDQAQEYVYDITSFEKKVRTISYKLRIPPEWLMAVMHSESKFDASVQNFKGSGATGLIQFMPNTIKAYNISTTKLRNLNHVDQMDYVYRYLKEKQKKFKPYETLTDLYIAILYPVALTKDFCYTLYAKPSKAYEMNVGLDEDEDGRVTISDIDKRMRRLYPTAYQKIFQQNKKPAAVEQFKSYFGF